MYNRIVLAALFLILCSGISASAGEPAQTQDTYTLGEVVVTAPEAKGVETIGTMHQITAEEIQRRGARSLDKALELLPGLDIRRGAQGIPRVDLRGMRSRHVILLLNGIPFNSTYDAQFDPAAISTENIAKIKVSYGNHSVLYGQGGLGGVINIITKKGTQKFSGGLSADITDRGDYTAQGDISGGTDKLDFFVSASRQDSDGFAMSGDFDATADEDGGIRENSDAQRDNLYANLGFSATDDLALGLVLGGSQGEFGQPQAIEGKLKYRRVDDYEGKFGQISAGYAPKGMFSVKAWAYVNKNEEYLTEYKKADYKDLISEQNDDIKISGATVMPSFSFENFGKLSFSLSGEKDSYDSDGYNKKGTIAQSHDIDLVSAAAEYEIGVTDSLELVAGYSHHWQNKDQGEDDDQGAWLIGVTYDLFDTTRLRTSYAHKIRFASIKNLYGDGGNENLTTEASDNFEIGVTQMLPYGIMADLAVYRNEVEDYIEKDDTDTYQNNDDYRFKGVELVLSKAFARASLSLGYSWMDAVDKSDGSDVDDLEYRPRHKITLQGSYSTESGFTAYASLMKVMDQIYYDGTAKEDLGDFMIVDVRLEQQVFRKNCFIYAGIDNLLDENYEESTTYPQAGRTAYAGMRVRF